MFNTYTVIAQLEIPIRSESREQAIDAVKQLIKDSGNTLSSYADKMQYFIPNDPDFDPTVEDRNRGILDD
jgi:hypothetical protein